MIDQFRGCLLGIATGEALGAQQAGPSEVEWSCGLGAQQALVTAEGYLSTGGFDPQGVADRLLDWYRSEPGELDSLTREACENLFYGYHFERAGHDAWEHAAAGGRLGSGSLARVIPTGLIRYYDNIHLVGESRVICGITHADEHCKLASVCLNLAVAHLLMVGVDGLLDELLEFIEPRNTVLGYALLAIPGLNVPDLRASGNVVVALQSALWAAIYCTDYEEGVLLLSHIGEDAATIGALGGALLGARFGVGAIPEDWQARLVERERIDDMARRLFTLCQELE